MIVVTTNDLPGYRVVRVIGLVRGITVRSRTYFNVSSMPPSIAPTAPTAMTVRS